MRHAATIARHCLLAGVLLVLATPAEVEAQDCGRWERSVLCQVEIQVARDRGRWERFEPRERQQIAPQQSLEIELRGWDQYRREFPRDRMTLAFDSYDCDRLLDVQDRGRGMIEIRATASSGSCRLDLWVPGNLNFEWRVDFEVSAQAREGYTRSEAEFLVRSLYRAILDRDVDGGSLSAAATEVQRGRIDSQVQAMVRSMEFRQSIRDLDGRQILDRFYLGLFARPVDSGGIRTYHNDVSRGYYEQVLTKMIRSGEFEDRLLLEGR